MACWSARKSHHLSVCVLCSPWPQKLPEGFFYHHSDTTFQSHHLCHVYQDKYDLYREHEQLLHARETQNHTWKTSFSNCPQWLMTLKKGSVFLICLHHLQIESSLCSRSVLSGCRGQVLGGLSEAPHAGMCKPLGWTVGSVGLSDPEWRGQKQAVTSQLFLQPRWVMYMSAPC